MASEDLLSPPQPGPVEQQAYWQPEAFDPYAKSAHLIDKNEHRVFRDLVDLGRWGRQNSRHPYTWGFTLYSACLTPDTTERLRGGIAKLSLCLRHWATQRRYAGLEPTEEYTELDARPTHGKILPSQDLARRFKLEVFDDYPGKDTVVAGGEDGDEDFMAIGRNFTEWVDNNALDTSDLYVPNDHCLIIDEKSLLSLEALPDHTPPPGPDDEVAEDGTACFLKSPQSDAWVWMLDREYYKKYARAKEPGGSETLLAPQNHPDERRFEPWVRTRISDLARVWFFRPRGLSPPSWESVVQRGQEKFDLVNWWGDASAATANDILRRQRRGEPLLFLAPYRRCEKGNLDGQWTEGRV